MSPQFIANHSVVNGVDVSPHLYIQISQSKPETAANWRPCLISHWQPYCQSKLWLCGNLTLPQKWKRIGCDRLCATRQLPPTPIDLPAPHACLTTALFFCIGLRGAPDHSGIMWSGAPRTTCYYHQLTCIPPQHTPQYSVQHYVQRRSSTSRWADHARLCPGSNHGNVDLEKQLISLSLPATIP